MDQHQSDKTVEDSKFKYKAASFLAGVSGISILSGFGYALATAKKSDPLMFDVGMTKSKQFKEAGSSLALRALGWGTLYAVGGVTVICCLIWKLSGANDMMEFRTNMGKVLPRIPKNDPPQGRTQFKGLTDLLQYVIDEDLNVKKQKQIEKERALDTDIK